MMKKIILTLLTILMCSEVLTITAQNLPVKSQAAVTTNYITKWGLLSQGGYDQITNSSIFDNGNIGIGTASPARKLHVQTSQTNGGIRITQTTLGCSSLDLSNATTGGHDYSLFSTGYGNGEGAGCFGIYDYTASDYRMFINNTGKIGIGTRTPNNLLQVKDLINFDNTYYNTALGYKTLYSNTSGIDNTANGYQSLYNNTSGSDNTAIGYKTLYSNTGEDNTATGSKALYTNTTGSGNLANGNEALQYNTTGSLNTAIGYEALIGNTEGNFNTAIGALALDVNTIGSQNTAVGVNALEYNTGGYNTAIGLDALYSNTTGENNTALGWYADVSSTGFTNATAIGSGALAANSDYVRIGNVNVSVIGGQVGWSNLSDGRFKFNIQENVKGLDFIKRLRPITYQMNTQAVDNFLIQNMPDSIKTKHQTGMNFAPSTAIIHSGFIAQEVDSVAHICGFVSSIVHTPANSTDPYALSYAEIVVPLVKAVQELSKTVDSLRINQKTTDSLQTAKINKLLNHQITTDSIITMLLNCCIAGTTQKNTQNDNLGQFNSQSIHNIELANNAILYQNAPNPFDDGTTIKYFVPDNTSAQIIFYDEFGHQIKVYKIEEKGMGQLNIGATNLAAGMYSYSLIVNEKVVDTKKMIKQ